MIVFISCVKTKRKIKIEAKNMYISDYFKKSLSYAKTLNPKKIYILSAKYGILELNEVIKPYNKTLNKMNKVERKKWGEKCYNQLKNKDIDLKQRFIFIGGKKYREFLQEKLEKTEVPMEGMGFGEQLSFMKKTIGGNK